VPVVAIIGDVVVVAVVVAVVVVVLSLRFMCVCVIKMQNTVGESKRKMSNSTVFLILGDRQHRCCAAAIVAFQFLRQCVNSQI
jgi:hypothetical protein